MRRLVCCSSVFLAAVLALPAWSQAPAAVEPASPPLLEHIYQQIEKRERPTQLPGLSTSANSALASSSLIDFMGTRTQLRQLGPKAYPLAPRIAELLAKSEKNQYDLAWILFEMTVQEDDSQATTNNAIARYRAESGFGKLAQLAKLGKIRSSAVVPELQAAATDSAPTTRLMAIIGLAYAGASVPDKAAATLGKALSDTEKFNRSAAANSLRLLGSRAETATPALIDYLKTRDNVYQAAGALNLMPIAAVRPAKPELENILGDSKLTEFQKRDVVNLLVRMESEK
ncbi:HEAT repeat domain-containing protein [Polaromonas sp. JS666]|uniref:HEAT repeat domain-containing protein n=1 Tax=Polaromonas sp. (strain JS666 / ATCC BAA-500) TaxID=296591 RepID=UPI0000534511|nr:HEAT repeat domain-containing protein [Polaromonas sp. JS666]ABE45936.1 hypothetical protein Bpro_4043 [Polaromonas sp. JS666]